MEMLTDAAKVGTATLATTGAAVNATTDIVGASTGTDTKNAQDKVTTNPVAATATLASGSPSVGSNASDMVTLVKPYSWRD